LILSSIQLTNFRNYNTEKFEFHDEVNVLVGKNGMGKTNVLEAIYYLCFGKSYFSSGDRYVFNKKDDFFRLEGNFRDGDSSDKVVIKYQSGAKKEIELSGIKAERISDHVGHFLCVIIAPHDIQLMLDGSEDRRNFINNTIVQTDKKYLEYLLQYTYLLKQRNTLLKSFAEKRTFDQLLLDSVTIGMYKPAQYIFEQRKNKIESLLPIFKELYFEISGGNEVCDINYESHLTDKSFKEILEKNVEKDRYLGRTSQGIHKDDLVFLMNGEPIKNFASQGQLKSFVLSIKLAQYKTIETDSGKKPLILLDDIFDKLDQSRVMQLLQLINKNRFGQVFITDSNKNRIDSVLKEIEVAYNKFSIENGAIVI